MSALNVSADDFIMGGGYPSAKFSQIGDYVEGVIDHKPTPQQQRNYETGDPEFWDNGEPKVQVRVVLQTDERDDSIPDDVGLRAVYVKAELQKAFRDAMRAVQVKTLEPGGWVRVSYVGNGVNKNPRLNPPKLYEVIYRPPTGTALPMEPGEAPAQEEEVISPDGYYRWDGQAWQPRS